MKNDDFFLGQTARTIRFWLFVNIWAFLLFLAVHFLGSFSRPCWWNDFFGVSSNLLAGGLVSFLFYFLLVEWPELKRKKIIKQNLYSTYRDIKRDLLRSIVHAANLGGNHDVHADEDTLDTLNNPSVFRDRFSGGQQANEGYYAVANHLQTESHQFDEIVQKLGTLAKQLEYVLAHYNFDDQHLFDQFRIAELDLTRLSNARPDYEGSKRVCQFFWQVCAGWSPLDGYRDFDVIEKMISDL